MVGTMAEPDRPTKAFWRGVRQSGGMEAFGVEGTRDRAPRQIGGMCGGG